MLRRGCTAVRLLAIAALCCAGTLAWAQTVTLTPLKDNTLFEDNGGNSNGAGQSVFAGETNFFGARRALLVFDIAGNVPAGATITSVELQLTMLQTIAGDHPMTIHRLLADWGEAGSVSAAGAGVPAQPGDATWTARFFPGSPWTTPGGDFNAAPSATQIVGDNGPYSWGSTPQMVADVQGWLDAGSNFGWILVGNEATAPTAKRFGSSENPVATARPELTINYTVGPPGAVPTVSEWGLILMALLLVSLASVVFVRRSVAVPVGPSADASTGFAPPFDARRYGRALAVLAAAATAALGLAGATVGLPSRVDVVGSLLCLPVLAYLVHLWLAPAED